MPLAITQTTPRKRYRRYCEQAPTRGCPCCLAALYEDDERCPECQEPPPLWGWPTPQALGEPALGQALTPHYVVTKILKSSPHDPRYRVISTRLVKDFSVKVLPTRGLDELSRQQLIAKLREHCARQASLETPHMSRIQDIVTTPDGEILVVLDLLCGLTLEQLVRTRGVPELGAARALLHHYLLGVKSLHDGGQLHGCLRPEGVMVDELLPGHLFASLTDPGLIHLLSDRAELLARLPAASRSPEHDDAQRARTPATDIHGLGTLFAFTLTGQLSLDASLLAQHHPTASAALCQQLAALIAQMTARQPGERPTLAQVEARYQALPWRRPALDLLEASEPPSPKPAGGPLGASLLLALDPTQDALRLHEELRAQHPKLAIVSHGSPHELLAMLPHRSPTLLVLDLHLGGSYDLTLYAQAQALTRAPIVVALPEPNAQLELQLYKFGAASVLSMKDSAALNSARILALFRRLPG